MWCPRDENVGPHSRVPFRIWQIYSAGHLAHDKIMRNIELYGRHVIPLVRDMLSSGS